MIHKKVCILGPTGVGKTSLVRQFVRGIFSDRYLTSIGVKIDKKEVALEQQTVQLMLWDMEGIDEYCGFNPRYLRGAAAFIIVVDQTRINSFQEGMVIYAEARKHSDIPALLVINKSDLPAADYWDTEEVNNVNMLFNECFHTSAKTGGNVEHMFSTLANIVIGN